MSNEEITVAVYDSHNQAAEAVRKLAQSGFDMKAISIVGKDYHTEEQPVGYVNTGERARFFGKLGAFWGGLAGMLFGSALMFIPVVGHIVVLGPLAATLVSGLEGAVLGGSISALAGALTTLGIPKDSVLRYETAVKADKFLVIAHGSASDLLRAQTILSNAGSVDVHSHPDSA